MKLKAPFPYFGGKSRIADDVWRHVGYVDHYIEPFCGSLAMLLGNPRQPKIETVNDADGLLVNTWRAVKYDPEGVAADVQRPVSELDLKAWWRRQPATTWYRRESEGRPEVVRPRDGMRLYMAAVEYNKRMGT